MVDTKLHLSLASLPLPEDAPGLKEELSLDRVLHQIGHERGSFRNFNENSIQAELDDPEHKLIALVDVDARAATSDSIDETKPPPLRETLLSSLGTALNESALALDFISLLLSGSSTHAEASMSPALKAAAPAGSLSHAQFIREADAIALSDEAKQVKQASLGSLAQTLTNASDRLSAASQSAEEDRALDDLFWAHVGALQRAGWPILKTRTTAGAVSGVCVRFGPHPAHLIHLTRSKSGAIDTSMLNSRDLSIHCRLRRHGVIVGAYSDALQQSKTQDPSTVAERLTRARQSIFAEGLFSDLARECQMQTSLAVQVDASSLQIQLSKDQSLEISLVEDVKAIKQDEIDEDDSMQIDQLEEDSESQARLLAQTIYAMLIELYAAKQQQQGEINATKTLILSSVLSCLTHSGHRATLVTALEARVAHLGRYEWDSPPILQLSSEDAPTEVKTLDPGLRIEEQKSTIRFSFLKLRCNMTIGSGLSVVAGEAADPLYALTLRPDAHDLSERHFATHDCAALLHVLDGAILEELVAFFVSSLQNQLEQVGERQIVCKENGRVFTVSLDDQGCLFFEREGQAKGREPHTLVKSGRAIEAFFSSWE